MREQNENFKDPRTRPNRCVARLNAHRAHMNGSVVFYRPIQAIRITDGQLPILLETMGTFGNPTSVANFRLSPIEKYENRRAGTDPPDDYAANQNTHREAAETDDEENNIEFAGPNGSICLAEPKKPNKIRNKPGHAEYSTRGAVNNSQGFPNSAAPRPSFCIRCGDPSHLSRPVRNHIGRYWIRMFHRTPQCERRI